MLRLVRSFCAIVYRRFRGFVLTLRPHSRYPSELHLNRNYWTKRVLPVPAPIGVNFIPFPSSQMTLNSPSSTSPSSFKRSVSANVSLLLCLGILSARSKREFLKAIIEPISWAGFSCFFPDFPCQNASELVLVILAS